VKRDESFLSGLGLDVLEHLLFVIDEELALFVERMRDGSHDVLLLRAARRCEVGCSPH